MEAINRSYSIPMKAEKSTFRLVFGIDFDITTPSDYFLGKVYSLKVWAITKDISDFTDLTGSTLVSPTGDTMPSGCILCVC